MVDFEELRRVFEAGDQLALYQALNACRHPAAEWVALPSWVVEALARREADRLRQLPGKGRGRNAPLLKQRRSDLIHLARHTECSRVVGALAFRRLIGLDVDAKMPTVSAIAGYVRDALKDTPYHEGHVTAGAISKSFDLIEAERAKDPKEFRRKFTFHDPHLLLVKNENE